MDMFSIYGWMITLLVIVEIIYETGSSDQTVP